MDIVTFLSSNPDTFLAIVTIMSLFVGSFLNVVIYRLPCMMEQNWSEECRIYLGLKPQKIDKINLWIPFSHCTQCKNLIRPWHNIPLFSYLWLQGKCATCKTPFSIRYPFVEGLTCILSVYVAFHYGFSLQTLFALLFTWIVICLTFIDLDHHMLPDQLTLFLLWLGLFASIFNIFCTSSEAILGGVIGYLIFALTQWCFEKITGKIGMGQGDFKFLAALGAYQGWQMLPFIILLASVCGLIFAGTHMVIKKEYKSVPIPFGPYLAISGWIALLYGDQILQYYLKVVY